MIARVLRRITGSVAFAVGLMGVVLTLGGIKQVWITAEHFSRDFPPTLDHLEVILSSIHQQGRGTVELLTVARERVKFVSDTAGEFANHHERRASTAVILESFEDDIGQRLSHAEEFIVSMQGSLRNMSNALRVLDSIPFLSPRIVSVDVRQESQLVSVAAGLTDAADLLEQLSVTIARLRLEQGITPQQLAQARETLRRVDDQLRDVQREVDEFSRRVELAVLQIESLKRHSPPWVERIATMATLFFVCFGFSQGQLLLSGWQLLRSG